MTTPRTLRRTDAPRSMFRRFPWGPFSEDFDQMLSQMFGPSAGQWMADFPQVDVAETEKEIEVRLDAPGFKAEQIQVQLDGEVLTISGHQEEEEKKEEDGKKWHVVERRSGSFTRTLPLPTAVDPNQIEAKLVDGVLKVHLVKSASPSARKIPVTS